MHSTGTIRRLPAISVVALVAMLATVLLPSLDSRAGDHRDGPEGTAPGGDTAADIGDLYAFEGSSETTVVAFTIPAPEEDAAFGSDLLYEVKVDTDGDAVEDQSFEFTFSDVRDNGAQFVVAQHAEAEAATNGTADGALAGFGQVGKELPLNNGGTLWTGLRSDPFFIDLAGLQGSILGTGDRQLNDGDQVDSFLEADVLAVVMEIPDYEAGIGLWATSSDADGNQIDRMGRPAINTVFNSAAFGDEADKDTYNQAEPANDLADFGANFADALMMMSAGDPVDGAYTQPQADELVGELLPDVLTFDKTSDRPAPFNGRALDDDVVDTLLTAFTGGDVLELFGADRDTEGEYNTDGIDAHSDYLSDFPYLGEPHAEWLVPVLEGEDFIASLSGTAEVPPVETPAAGVSTLNAAEGSLDHLELAYDLVDAVAAHIHLGDPGENGPVAVLLYESEGEDVSGMLAQGTVEDADMAAGTVADLLDVLNGGFGYVNVHTTANPAGEIRGQVAPLSMVVDAFTDDDASVHREDIDVIAAAGITKGCNPPDNTEYCPDREISRGEMAAFLARALNVTSDQDAFTDDDASIFEAEINGIASFGITRGCNPPDNTEFCPDDPLTRGEMAAFVARAWSLPGATSDHFDDDEASIFEAEINALAEAGITRGCNPPDNTEFCPERNMSRAEMASFLARAFGWSPLSDA